MQQGVVIEDEGLEVHQPSHLWREALQLVVAQVKVEQVREVDEKLVGDGLDAAGTCEPSGWPWMCTESNPERGTQSKVGSGGDRWRCSWSCAARAPPVVAQVEHQHVLGILQLPGTLSQIIAAQVLGDESGHHPQSWDGSPIPQLPPTPKDHGASLGPRSRCSSVPRVSSKGTNERDSMKTQHLPAPRGPPAGRCHQGLLSSSGCLHVPRLPSKRTERNDCSLAPATC